ncbi:hypothetical protein K458DRAFT_386867 [Lentithecium fluviatile CBS 122367]|uniref:Uncharacterized protein n=1 Tax=Lentithecium fluviatile CBS 122367 TaxID=1168545 RepID=A0A6G1J8P9_9PLEO|nr:hypothetical protein K458DRAFT_386867 [Lentithecium fluviatile CBS 122367]
MSKLLGKVRQRLEDWCEYYGVDKECKRSLDYRRPWEIVFNVNGCLWTTHDKLRYACRLPEGKTKCRWKGKVSKPSSKEERIEFTKRHVGIEGKVEDQSEEKEEEYNQLYGCCEDGIEQCRREVPEQGPPMDGDGRIGLGLSESKKEETYSVRYTCPNRDYTGIPEPEESLQRAKDSVEILGVVCRESGVAMEYHRQPDGFPVCEKCADSGASCYKQLSMRAPDVQL